MRVAGFLLAALGLIGCKHAERTPQSPPPSNRLRQQAGYELATQPADAGGSTAAVLGADSEDDPLVLVAKCLDRADHLGAATHLERYVAQNADQPMFRLQLAELYLRADRAKEAKFHYEQFAADAQSGSVAIQSQLVNTHIKLREIAQNTGDRFGEAYHRGIGLLLLVKEQDRAKDRDEAFCEEMLCKAISALMEAKAARPGDPRVRVYLADAHDRAGNPHAANAERTAARTNVASGELTDSERKPLLLSE